MNLVLKKVLIMSLLGVLALVHRSLPPTLHAGDAAVTLGDGTFFDSGQSLGNAVSRAVALGDLNGNGYVDAFVANTDGPNRVWFNNGAGHFSDSGQLLGNLASQAAVLGDLDGDGDLDTFVANSNGPNQVWRNDGAGHFSNSGQNLGNSPSNSVALGDLDGDGDLDAFVANGINPNKVWLNNGNGIFSDSGQDLGTSNSYDVALADLDGDGDLDAFIANGLSGPQPDEVWFNNGSGVFSDSGQSLGADWSYAVALADVDGDGDVDAFTASWFSTANRVWLNNGSGTFTNSGQNPGSAASIGVSLGDVDGDNDPDAVVANNFPEAIEVWVNNGSGAFSDSGQMLGETTTTSYGAGLADLDGDGDLDIFAANFGPNTVWFNGPPGLPTAVFDVERTINDEGDDVTYWASAGNALLSVLLNRPASQAIDVHVQITTATGTTTQLLPFTAGEQVKFLNLVNPQPNPSEAADLTLSVTPAGGTPGPADVTDRLKLVFVDGEQGMKDCILCYVEWLGRLVGVDSSFGVMHHLELPEQEASPQWGYYTGLFDYYSPELATIIATNPSLLWDSIVVLDGWTPAVQSLADGSGGATIISEAMTGNSDALLNDIRTKASPGLQALIQREQNAMDVPSLTGLTMDQAWNAVEERRPISELYLTVVLK